MGGIAAPPLTCSNHPGRTAIALCMRCRVPVCGDCTTRFQGVHHCSRCVAELGRARLPSRPEPMVRTVALVLAAYGSLTGIFYAVAVYLAR